MSEQKTDRALPGQHVNLPPGLRVVCVNYRESRLMDGDAEQSQLGSTALPGLLKLGWSVAFILPISGGHFYFFLAPPSPAK